MKPLLTPKDIANLIGVSYRQVLTLIAIGDLAAIKIGNAYRIAEADLEEYLESNRFKCEWPT